jgi:glycosidase
VRAGRELVYQIFPDRWRRSGAPDPTPEEEKIDGRSFYGGDLKGITAGLPYLLELGVTALYLTPIFSATSPHRYDTIDYRTIDPRLGTRHDFDEMVAALRKTGILLILDGVLNHTSHEHPWHRDPRERRRRYIMKNEDQAMTWLDKGSLPKLDMENPRVRKEMLEVLAAWPGVDGWRLDAAHLYPHAFLREVRRRIGRRYLILEDWILSPHYAAKRLADGVTNFPFRENARTYFVEDASPETFLARTAAVTRLYPRRFLDRSWNYLDNHDTDRFLSIVGRPRLFRALILLFTLPGLPMLYHGIEAGLAGRNPAESRRPMPWRDEQWDREARRHVIRLAALRRESNALALGAFQPLFAENRSRTFAFERRWRDERVVVAMNDGYRAARLPLTRRRLAPGESFLLFERRGLRPVLHLFPPVEG